MVSNFDSTPARKVPHLEAFCVVDGSDAIMYRKKALVNVTSVKCHDPSINARQAVPIVQELVSSASLRLAGQT